jgi:hypothetical protein
VPELLYLCLGMVLGGALAYLTRRSFSFQNDGEKTVARILQSNFNTRDYHLLNHVTLEFHGNTTQIDHILVSRFGIFVIETKDYKGWIFANANHDTWTQVIFKAKFKFRNPIKQNSRHIQAVRELLDFLPESAIQPIVVFAGTAEFKNSVPAGVFTVPSLVRHLKRFTEELISPNRLQFCVGRLETARLAISQETDLKHVQGLRKRYNLRN